MQESKKKSAEELKEKVKGGKPIQEKNNLNNKKEKEEKKEAEKEHLDLENGKVGDDERVERVENGEVGDDEELKNENLRGEIV